VDSYSAFFDNQRKSETVLNRELARREISDLYVCGLAYDICVASTTLDALEIGYKAAIVDDCTRGLDLKEIQSTKDRVRKQNGVITESTDVPALVAGKRIPWNWAYGVAIRLFKN